MEPHQCSFIIPLVRTFIEGTSHKPCATWLEPQTNGQLRWGVCHCIACSTHPPHLNPQKTDWNSFLPNKIAFNGKHHYRISTISHHSITPRWNLAATVGGHTFLVFATCSHLGGLWRNSKGCLLNKRPIKNDIHCIYHKYQHCVNILVSLCQYHIIIVHVLHCTTTISTNNDWRNVPSLDTH